MNVDYDLLESYATELRNELKQLSNAVNNIEDSYNKICNSSNWNSPTRDFFKRKTDIVEQNKAHNFDKQNNVNRYLETVIANYRKTEKNMGKIISNSFGR